MWVKTALVVSLLVSVCRVSHGAKSNKIEDILDHKDFKKLLKTKNNVLVCFHDLPKAGAGSKTLALLAEVAEKVKGFGTVASVDCGDKVSRIARWHIFKPKSQYG
jgi:hypothetical protein